MNNFCQRIGLSSLSSAEKFQAVLLSLAFLFLSSCGSNVDDLEVISTQVIKKDRGVSIEVKPIEKGK